MTDDDVRLSVRFNPPKPSARWPNEPPAGDADEDGTAGDREPRMPLSPVDAAAIEPTFADE